VIFNPWCVHNQLLNALNEHPILLSHVTILKKKINQNCVSLYQFGQHSEQSSHLKYLPRLFVAEELVHTSHKLSGIIAEEKEIIIIIIIIMLFGLNFFK
jgi:hypothetical protein